MTYQNPSLCISCGHTYEQEKRYHGYYCIDCRLKPSRQRGVAE